MSGILRLESLTKGNTLKQGDKTPLKYRLFDADGEKLNIAGKSAVARLMYPDFIRVGYESETLTVSPDNTVTFSIDKVIKPVLYYVEITVDDKYIFPSRVDESKINIDKSSKGSDVAIIEIIGKDILIRDVREQVETEIKPVVDDMIIANQKVLENEKIVQDVNSLAQQLENRQNQVEQFNNQVITEMTDKDVISAPEILGARGSFDTLGERLNDTTAQLAQTSLKKANQIGIDVTNPPNGLTPAKADGVTDDTLAINNILLYAEAQGIKNVFIPEGNYRITDTINLFRELQLTLAHNAVIRFVSLTNNIFKMATRSVLKGGKILTSYDFKGSVFYYRGVVVNSTVDGTKCYGTQGTHETGFRDINTGTIVHFDGYYSTKATEDVRMNGYCQYNTVKNVYAQWYGTFLKAVVNLDRPFGTNPWFTANTFFNIELERVNRVVDMNVGGANFFDHMRVQCGPQDDLLFSLRGKTDLNRFTNIIYYDIVEQTQIVEMGKSSAHNYFELWYDISEYRAKTINLGYRNRIEAPGAMLEVPKEIPLTAEWVKKTGAYPEARVFKTKEGIAHIEGVVTNLTETTGEPFNGLIGVLPVGYRPREIVIYSVPSGNFEQTNVWINPSNGEIRAYSNVPEIHLSGIAPYRA